MFDSNTEGASCTNCNQLSGKIYSLQESISNLCTIIQQQNDSIMSAFAEIMSVTTNLARQESIVASTNYFPVASDEMLQDLDEQINADNRQIYLSTMIKLWGNNVLKNLECILDRNIVMNYNIDGSYGKRKLKEYNNFYTLLIDSIESLPSMAEKDPETTLRRAMQLCKKKQIQQKAAFNKKLGEWKSNSI